ncbi:MAG: ATP-binding protein, partial [Phycisphaerae bacterium]|nr:ATP-binding protein [Phycisphaerae bacterium]NIX28505.1 ATP-binding protein [Phycisphaerae bacterium]
MTLTSTNAGVDTLDGWQPPPVNSLEDTGLSSGFLSDMILKVMYFRGQMTGYQIAEHLRVPFQTVLHSLMDHLKREQFCEVKGSGGLGAGAYQYTITNKGANRAREQIDRSTYAEAAPVTWEDY